MPCLEAGREMQYKDESSISTCQKLFAMLPTAGQAGATLNALTLAGVMYAIKLMRDDVDSTDEVLLALVSGNSTA